MYALPECCLLPGKYYTPKPTQMLIVRITIKVHGEKPGNGPVGIALHVVVWKEIYTTLFQAVFFFGFFDV